MIEQYIVTQESSGYFHVDRWRFPANQRAYRARIWEGWTAPDVCGPASALLALWAAAQRLDPGLTALADQLEAELAEGEH